MAKTFDKLIAQKREGAVFFGDWHGDTFFAIRALERAIDKYPDIDVYYHVGDFGIWPKDTFYLDAITGILESAEKLLVVTGGNHEDWDRWDDLTKNQTVPYVFPGDSLVLLPKLYHWEHADYRFTSVGGASSIDKFRRKKGRDWWPQEIISEEVIETLEEKDLSCDVLITHESSDNPVPPVQQLLDNPWQQGQWPEEDREISTAQRELVSRAVAATYPQYHFHGHWHIPHVREGNPVTVSLGANFASFAENEFAIAQFI